MNQHTQRIEQNFRGQNFLAFNIQLSALFLHIMARLTGYTPGSSTMFVSDAHVYVNHIEGVTELLSREHFEQPTLGMSDHLQPLQSVDEIPGIFTKIQPEDFWLDNYQCHPAIKFPMAA